MNRMPPLQRLVLILLFITFVVLIGYGWSAIARDPVETAGLSGIAQTEATLWVAH